MKFYFDFISKTKNTKKLKMYLPPSHTPSPRYCTVSTMSSMKGRHFLS